MRYKYLLLILAGLWLGGCSSNDKKEEADTPEVISTILHKAVSVPEIILVLLKPYLESKDLIHLVFMLSKQEQI